MSASSVDFNLDDLPMDVFDLDETGLSVETLTDGPAMAETGRWCCHCSSVSCCCDYQRPN